jgi:protease I
MKLNMKLGNRYILDLRTIVMAFSLFLFTGLAANAQQYPEGEVQFDLDEEVEEADTYIPSRPEGVEMKGRILMITEDEFNDTEVLYALYRLVEEGYEVTVATLEGGEVAGYNSAPIKKTIPLEEVNVDDYAALYIPGGDAPEKLREEEIVQETVKKFAEQEKLIGAICHGPQILASAGLLDGKEMTAYPELSEEMKEAGANFVDQPVVVDGNLITARVPGDLPAHLRQFIDALEGDFASDVEESLEDAEEWIEERLDEAEEGIRGEQDDDDEQ